VNAVLRRLASRVLPGAGDIVRPRLRSRFEGGPGPADAVDMGLAAPRPGIAPPVATPSPAPSGEAAPVTATAAPVAAAAAAAAAVAAPRDAPPMAVPRTAAARAPDPTSPSFDPIAPEPLSNAPGRPAAAAAAGAAPAVPVSVEIMAVPPGAPAQPQGEAGHRLEPRASPLLLPEMRLPEGPEAAMASEAPGRSDALPPDIRISIGRIDVRAGGDPRVTPPRPRARPRPNLMSLEDYLGKGRRRP